MCISITYIDVYTCVKHIYVGKNVSWADILVFTFPRKIPIQGTIHTSHTPSCVSYTKSLGTGCVGRVGTFQDL